MSSKDINKKALRNYLACSRLLKMYRKELLNYSPKYLDLYSMSKRKELLDKSRKSLETMRILRVNAL